MKRTLKVFLILLIVPFISFSQGKADKKYEKELYQKANEHMYNENYVEAQKSYLNLLEIVPNNDLYLLETGLSYFFAPSGKDKALGYLEKAKETSRSDTLIELYYYLGRAYQLNSDFSKAVSNYEKFKNFLKDNKTGKRMSEEIEGYIRMCQHGEYHLNLFAQNPVEGAGKPLNGVTRYFVNDSDFVAIENLGKKLNSQYSDYTPLLLNKGNKIVFPQEGIELMAAVKLNLMDNSMKKFLCLVLLMVNGSNLLKLIILAFLDQHFKILRKTKMLLFI